MVKEEGEGGGGSRTDLFQMAGRYNLAVSEGD